MHLPSHASADARRRLTALALPVLAELLLSYAVGFFDTFLSGRFGAAATHAVGLAAYVSWLMSMMFGLVSAGTTALVSRHWGAGEFSIARSVLNRSVAVAFLLSLVFAVLIGSAAPHLAAQLGMQGEGLAIATRYLRFESVGFLFTGVTLAGAAALRGSGDTRTPMFILGTVSVVNAIASCLFVFGPGPLPQLGVDGIVGGTIVARACGGILMLLALFRGGNELRLSRSELRFWDPLVIRIVRIGLPAVVDGVCTWSGHYLFLGIIGRLSAGPVAAAAHMVGIRVEELGYLPALAFGIASAALIGQSLGRGEEATARRFGHLAALFGGTMAAAVGVGFYIAAPWIFSLMHSDSVVHEIGVPAFRAMAFFQAPLAIAIVYTQALRGAGDTRSPMVIALISVYLVRVPLAWFFGIHLDMGLLGAWFGMFADISLRALLLSLRYASGRWLNTRV